MIDCPTLRLTRFKSPLFLAALLGSTVVIADSGFATPSGHAHSVIMAERRLARASARVGIRKAYASAAAPDAEIFIPDPTPVVEWLTKDARYWNPSTTEDWVTTAVYLSCDGRSAVTIGFWYDDEENGYYANLWTRSRGSWRWQLHFDDREAKAPIPRVKTPRVTRASCRKADPELVPKEVSDAATYERRGSTDHTIEFRLWNVRSDYQLGVYQWDGKRYRTIIRKAIGHDYE